MQTLQYWQEKIQEKRKQTPFRDFVRDVCSGLPLLFNKERGKFSRYPKTDRIAGIASVGDVDEQHEEIYDGNFHQSLLNLRSKSYFPAFLQRGENENCEYADIVLNAKDAYLSIAVVGDTSRVLYSLSVKHNCNDVISSVMTRRNSSNVFESSCIMNSAGVYYSHTIQNSSNIWFCQNLINCHNCILSQDLENQSYCIRNKQYAEADYAAARDELLKDKSMFESYKNQLNQPSSNQGSQDSVGQGILNSDDVKQAYYVNQIAHGRNVVLFGSAGSSEHIYDAITGGSPYGNHLYGGLSLSGEHIYCGGHCEDCSHVYYCYDIEGCSYCLGCVGIKNKSYCILNKQYTKEERYEKVDEIFTQLDKKGTLGDFFPGNMNPFYFNDTTAYLIDPSFTKEEVTALGYLRRDEPMKVDIPDRMETVKGNDLAQFEGYVDGVWSIDPIILKKVIVDEEGNSYRVVKLEYDFLVKHGLPLPRKHWLERMKDNFRL